MQRGEKEHALLHACLAIDGTARKLYELTHTTRKHYLRCVRDYYWLLSAFMPGLALEAVRFPHVPITDNQGKHIPQPDIADIIYYVFRCNSAHANQIPFNYQLIETAQKGQTAWGFSKNILMIPERVIWGLLAISVFSKANIDTIFVGDFFLSYQGNECAWHAIFPIKDFWGKEAEIRAFLKQYPPILSEPDLSKYM